MCKILTRQVLLTFALLTTFQMELVASKDTIVFAIDDSSYITLRALDTKTKRYVISSNYSYQNNGFWEGYDYYLSNWKLDSILYRGDLSFTFLKMRQKEGLYYLSNSYGLDCYQEIEKGCKSFKSSLQSKSIKGAQCFRSMGTNGTKTSKYRIHYSICNGDITRIEEIIYVNSNEIKRGVQVLFNQKSITWIMEYSNNINHGVHMVFGGGRKLMYLYLSRNGNRYARYRYVDIQKLFK